MKIDINLISGYKQRNDKMHTLQRQNIRTQTIQKRKTSGSRVPIKVNGNLPVNIKNKSILNVVKNGSHPIHILGNPHSAKFIAQIPRWAIEKYTEKNSVILDPFVGSGTTLVEARLLNRNSLGIDNNPLARLMSKVKSTSLSERKLNNARKKIELLLQNKNNEKFVIPEFTNRDFWFDKPASRGIAIIKKQIKKLDVDVTDFFIIVLSETIHKVSKVANGQILAAARKNHQEHERFTVNQVKRQFLEQLDLQIPRMIDFSKQISQKNFSKIIGNDAEKIKYREKIDMIISSPPYINAHHYIWAHKLRLLQLGLVDDQFRSQLMRKEMGTENVEYREFTSPPKTGISSLDLKIVDIFRGKVYQAKRKENVIRAVSTYQYFSKMKNHFVNAYDLLQNKSTYCLVAGNNTICGIKIPTSKYLSKIAQSVGFKEKLQFDVLLKNRTLNMPRNVSWANAIKSEKVIVLTK